MRRGQLWSSARELELARLVEAGHSPAVTAATMGDVSRNAVIGKAKRLGLRWHIPEPVTQQERNARRREARQAAGTAPRGERRPAIKIPGHPERGPIEVPPEMKQLRLMELGPHDCRWPIGPMAAKAELFCGADKETERSYCKFHHDRSWRVAVKTPQKSKQERIREFKKNLLEIQQGIVHR